MTTYLELIASVRFLREKSIMLEKGLADLGNENAVLRSQTSTSLGENITLKQEIAKLKTENALLRSKMAALGDQQPFREQKIASLQQESALLRNILAASVDEIITLKQEIAKLKTENAYLRAGLRDSERKSLNYSEIIEWLKARTSTFANMLANQRGIIIALGKQSDLYQRDIRVLNRMLTENGAEIGRYAEQVEKLKKQIQDLQKPIDIEEGSPTQIPAFESLWGG